MTEDKIRRILNKGLTGTKKNQRLILVSHSSPMNISADRIIIGSHAGSIGVIRFIEKDEISAVFCRHINESKGVGHIGRSLIVNPRTEEDGNITVVFCRIRNYRPGEYLQLNPR